MSTESEALAVPLANDESSEAESSSLSMSLSDFVTEFGDVFGVNYAGRPTTIILAGVDRDQNATSSPC